MKRAVVLGAGGLLGRYLVAALEDPARSLTVRGLTRGECDITDERRAREAVAGADLVVNAAAFTDVDGAEQRPEAAYAVNALGPENLARASDASGAIFVHVSTDFVFDGALDRPYDEFDAPNPESIYARSKRAGEVLVERAARRSHVVRVQGLYGEGGRNFSSKLADILRQGRPGLRLDAERKVQPTYARAAARAIADIAATDRYGTWHASCRGATTWHEFALRMAERLGVKPYWEAVGSSTLTLAAKRPPNCLLETRRMSMVGLPSMPPWQAALDGYLHDSGPAASRGR